MLQLMAGLPFWQCPVPSTPSFTVVKPAPVTAAAGTATRAAATATANPVMLKRARRPNHLDTGITLLAEKKPAERRP